MSGSSSGRNKTKIAVDRIEGKGIVSNSFIRIIGVLLILGGLVAFGYGFNLDPTLPVPGGEAIGISRVANIHLLSQKRNLTWGGAGAAAFGFILLIIGERLPERKDPDDGAS